MHAKTRAEGLRTKGLGTGLVWQGQICRRTASVRTRLGQTGHAARVFKGAAPGATLRRRTLVVEAVVQQPPSIQPPPDIEVTIEGVKAYNVAKGVYCVRGMSTERLKYEIEFGLKRGTTDNSYLVQGNSRGSGILIDVPLQAYTRDFVSGLKSVLPLNRISAIVLTHIAPNRIAPLKAVLAEALQGRSSSASRLSIVCTKLGMDLLQKSLGEDAASSLDLSQIDFVVAKQGTEVAVGPGRNPLKVILTPTPRWPDLMCVYDADNKLVFSSKLFSAHVTPSMTRAGQEAVESPYDVGGYEEYGNDWKYYFDCMLAPVARQASAALDKLQLQVVRNNTGGALLRGLMGVLLGKAPPAPSTAQGAPLPVVALAPLHGPVIKTGLAQLIRDYQMWTEEQLDAAVEKSVAVLYASAYGNTAALAQAISRGITKGGAAVNTLNLELCELQEVTSALDTARGFIIGSPTLGGHMPTQVQVALGAILQHPRAKNLPCGVFGSFGWSGEAVDELERRLRDAGYSFGFDALRVKFKPTAKDLQMCEQAGRDLAVKVAKKKKLEERAAGGSNLQRLASGTQLAMGRVVGSVCVITARDEDATSAMLVTWVSQASFDPPGLTVAVSKDKSIDDLLPVGAKFNVNIIPEAAEREIMRTLTRPLQPGQDRLRGLEAEVNEVTGCKVLKDASAYLDCQVTAKMDTGDHCLIYATVTTGKLLQDTALTAVHHRKVGNHY